MGTSHTMSFHAKKTQGVTGVTPYAASKFVYCWDIDDGCMNDLPLCLRLEGSRSC